MNRIKGFKFISHDQSMVYTCDVVSTNFEFVLKTLCGKEYKMVIPVNGITSSDFRVLTKSILIEALNNLYPDKNRRLEDFYG